MTARAIVLAGVPVLIATPDSVASPTRPAVLWMHGFRADALALAAELERCAALGFVAVGVDAVDHGARGGPQLAERLHGSANGALSVMLGIVEATVRELPALIDALVVECQWTVAVFRWLESRWEPFLPIAQWRTAHPFVAW